MQRHHVVGALWLTACATVIGTAGLVSYDPCNLDESANAQRWLMIVVSGVVVGSATFFTLARPRAAVLRLLVASALGLAVLAGLAVIAPGACSGSAFLGA